MMAAGAQEAASILPRHCSARFVCRWSMSNTELIPFSSLGAFCLCKKEGLRKCPILLSDNYFQSFWEAFCYIKAPARRWGEGDLGGHGDKACGKPEPALCSAKEAWHLVDTSCCITSAFWLVGLEATCTPSKNSS